ncbi:MAG: histidinol dehydrogenase [Flavobacteriaceae bacterium]
MRRVNNPSIDQWGALCTRPTASLDDVMPVVDEVFDAIQTQGDQAIQRFSEKFDGYQPKSIEVAQKDLQNAQNELSADLKNAIDKAYENIYAFHQAQKTSRVQVEVQDGVSCWQEKRPIEKVGLYIPGGTAPLFSSILMLAIPATIAGCREIVLCTPPNSSGILDPAIRYAAYKCGVTRLFQVGGIQAIGGLTFGTESIPKVYKILGPGNQYVTAAKQKATQYGVSIDMPAGPSELLVVADDTAVPSYVAADLLSQAEHGVDSQVVLVSISQKIIDEVQEELQKQMIALPRKDIAAKALENSTAIYFDAESKAIDFINEYGPEHYIICMSNEEGFVSGVVNAGSVFIGNYTPESAGDYASGTNHTLPTNGYAKQYSGVNLDSFLKAITFQKISSKGLQDLGPSIETLAEAEGLFAHKNAVSVRLNDLK